MEGRYKDDRTCSLQTVQGGDIAPMEYCSFLPGRGENRHKRVLIQFGESRCKFTLRNCVPVREKIRSDWIVLPENQKMKIRRLPLALLLCMMDSCGFFFAPLV